MGGGQGGKEGGEEGGKEGKESEGGEMAEASNESSCISTCTLLHLARCPDESTCTTDTSYNVHLGITPTVVGVYRDWPGSSALNLYI